MADPNYIGRVDLTDAAIAALAAAIAAAIIAGQANSHGTTVGVAVTNVATTLAAANSARRALKITNRLGNDPLFINLSDTVPTTTLFEFMILPGATYEDIRPKPYTGIVRGILGVAGPQTVNVGEGSV